jgi:hypothetical protein
LLISLQRCEQTPEPQRKSANRLRPEKQKPRNAGPSYSMALPVT